MPKHLAILGSTGSIGQQALEVVAQHPDQLIVEVLTAQTQSERLIEQALKYHPNTVVIVDKNSYRTVADRLQPEGIKVFCGTESLVDITSHNDVDTVLNAIVGFAGLAPSLEAIRAGKNLALANKESLVVGGDLLAPAIAAGKLIPIDSEHSAIFQCLVGENRNPIRKILLTGSGGPFRGKKTSELTAITPQQALKHPTWNMGAKISIDSATLFNKGLEVIEAHWLFNIDYDRIEVTIHPQSIVHSMVLFEDGAVKAQLGVPSMKVPIQYALSFPERWPLNENTPNFQTPLNLTFDQPDLATFGALNLAFEAGRAGGILPAVLNAANEVAVEAFLNHQIPFLQIFDICQSCCHQTPNQKVESYQQLVAIDTQTRLLASTLASRQKPL